MNGQTENLNRLLVSLDRTKLTLILVVMMWALVW